MSANASIPLAVWAAIALYVCLAFSMAWHAFNGLTGTGTTLFVFRCFLVLALSAATVYFTVMRSGLAVSSATLAVVGWIGWLLWIQFKNYTVNGQFVDMILAFIVLIAVLAAMSIAILVRYLGSLG